MDMMLRYLLIALAVLIALPAFFCVLFCGLLILLAAWLWDVADRLKRSKKTFWSLPL